MTTAAAPYPQQQQSSNKPHPSDDQQHNMISLYYCYPPSSIEQNQLQPHANFHRETCTKLNLGGRIRVSEEGINGVLSGTEENLREYEDRLRKELMALFSNDEHDIESNNDDQEDPTVEWLDMKYCHLRKDVPVEKQLFDALSVKITREVVSLIEPVAVNNRGGKNKGRARCRQRRKQRRKEKQRLEKLQQKSTGEQILEGGKESIIGDNEVEQTIMKQQYRDDDAASLTQQLESTHLVGQEGSVAPTSGCVSNEIGTAVPIRDWEKQTPAVHLSPQEWNEKLLQLSRDKHDQSENNTNVSSDCATEEHPMDMGEDAILLDTRNMYESRVGHFAVPNLETFFPNTRKFSSLPNALNTEEAAKALAGKQVFMYCTGGVRCERAGSYLRALSESNSGAWKDKEQPKGIYQLRGGIQKYLESYGREEIEPANRKRGENTKESVSEIDSVEANGTNSCQTDMQCLYRGKNFVFDPRRTDPFIGNGITNDDDAAASNGARISLVGQCIVCSSPHDDYDNGHAPCEEREARCCRCRILVLVCDGCRQQVRSWGESQAGDGDTDEQGDGASKTDLFCGNDGATCVDDGNVAEKVETARF